ncbi:MAG: hypothetical protein LM588_00495 [Fervidicoccaceae archaeon]|nr:hypothetical protein [Fervidicoccaceae archaeon]
MSTLTLSEILGTSEGNGEALVLGHCVLNMNTRAPGIAAWRGGILPLMRMLLSYHGEIHQYPCLEAAVVGMRRWWHVKEQYDTFSFRLLSRRIAEMYASYFSRVGFKKVKVLGLGLSPTCGYRYTQSDASWGGRPREIDPSRNIKSGSGVLIEEMHKALSNAGLSVEFLDVSPSLIYPDYEARVKVASAYPSTPETALDELARFLGTEALYLKEEVKHIHGLKQDLRSMRTIVAPRALFQKKLPMMIDLAEEGYGITLIEDIHGDKDEEDLLVNIYASIIGNMVVAGHNVKIVLDNEHGNSLIQTIIDVLRKNLPEKTKLQVQDKID